MLPITKPSQSQEQFCPSLLQVHKKKKEVTSTFLLKNRNMLKIPKLGRGIWKKQILEPLEKGFSGSLALTIQAPLPTHTWNKPKGLH